MPPPLCRAALRRYYAATALYDCVFAYAIYTVLFSLRGLSVWQIGLLLSWWSLTSLLLEVPTGALADTCDRRVLLALAPLVKSACFVTWAFAAGSFALYALGFAFWSLGSSLVSGTREAWLYDTLSAHDCTDEYERVAGRGQCYNLLAMGGALVLGGLLAQWRLELPLVLSVVPLGVCALCAAGLPEAPRGAAAEGRTTYCGHLRAAGRELCSNRTLLVLLVYLMGVGVMGELEEFDQLYYRLAGLPLGLFGLAGFVGALGLAAGAYYAHRVRHSRWVFAALPLLIGLGLAAVARWPRPGTIVLLLGCHSLAAPVRVLAESRLQRAIRGESRATVTSAVALLIGLMCVATPALCGLLSRLWNLQAVYLAGGLLLGAVGGWAVVVRRHLAGPGALQRGEAEGAGAGHGRE